MCVCLTAAYTDVRAFVKGGYHTLLNEDGDLQHLVWMEGRVREEKMEGGRGREGEGGRKGGREGEGREGREGR